MRCLHGCGIIFIVLLSCSEIRARVIPETTSTESKEEPGENTYKFLDQISASKIECLLKFIEQPGANPECVDTLFGDERSQFLLDELSRELVGNLFSDEGTTNGDEDKDDQLVADLNTLSGQAGRFSTVNDEVPMIDSNKDKRVDEQVDTPKKEEQRNDNGQQSDDQGNVAEVVKSVDETDDGNKEENQINSDDEVEDDYEYDSSLVSKLYNMLQDLVMKETFDYGLNMDEDDDDSDEEQTQNTDKNALATKEDEKASGEEEEDNETTGKEKENKNIQFEKQNKFGVKQQNEENEIGRDSQEEDSEEEEEAGQGANKTAMGDENEEEEEEEDEIEKELKQMQGTQTEEEEEDDDADSDDDDEAENVDELENDLVQELDRMLSVARQAAAGEGKGKAPAKKNTDVFSNDKFMEDLRNMEKQLKKSSD